MKTLPDNLILSSISTPAQLEQAWAFAAPILDLPRGKHTLAFYQEQIRLTPLLSVCAARGGQVCGCILASIEEDHVLVGAVAVAADARRLGLGAAMLAEVERQSRALGQTTLLLGSLEEAESFYLDCGFQPNLFIQYAGAGGLEALKPLRGEYAIAWQAEDGGWARLMLRTPQIDKALQHAYEETFPGCYTQYVFIKNLDAS